MFSSLFGTKSHAFNIDLEVLADPALIVGADGRVIDANGSFTKQMGWQKNELLKESVHMLIPNRVISKRNHDEKMKSYKYGQKSNFIGYDKVLPVKDNHEKEHLCHVRIVPVQQTSKKVQFLCFFKPAQNLHVTLNPKAVFEEIRESLKDMPSDYAFRDTLPDRKDLATLRLCKEYIQGELDSLRFLIVDNCTVPAMINYIVSVIHEPRTPHLRSLQALLNRSVARGDIAYLNIVTLRLLFPILMSKHSETREEFKLIFQKIYDLLNKDQASSMESIEFETSRLLIDFASESDYSRSEYEN